MSSTVRSEYHQGVTVITLDRPDRLNAINRTLARELKDAVDAASNDSSVGCIVLTGSGRAFSSGADLQDAPSTVSDVERSMREIYNPLVEAIAIANVPTVAMVNGLAVGAGASLALACDLRVCSDSAEFRFAFSKVGLIPDCGATYHLPRLVGYGRAIELAYLGQPVRALAAVRMGLASRAVGEESLRDVTMDIAGGLAAGPTAAYVQTRQAFQRAQSSNLSASLALEASLQLDLVTSDEFGDAVSRYQSNPES